MVAWQERIEGGLIGLLVGDALGVPYEFHAPNALPLTAFLEFQPPIAFGRSHNGVPPGTGSDDGAQALCLLASLLECGEFLPDDFGDRLVRWHDEGYMAVDGIVFDIGITTAAAIRAMRAGTPALQAGPNGEYDNGNGSLMRALPLVLWHRGSDAELVSDAHLQSRVTHGHLRSQICCALYCLWARRVLQEAPQPWPDAVATLRDLYAGHKPALQELEHSILPQCDMQGSGSGYVIDCLRSARWKVELRTYERVVKGAVALGNDTDTTACVAGGIAGLRYGIEAIPARWRRHLRGQELVKPLLKSLLARGQ